MAEKTQRLDENELRQLADGSVDVEGIPRDGQPLPDGFQNPPGGSMGHRCLDPRGIYHKDWYCLKLHKSDGMPTRQHFNCAGKSYKILVGAWVDVPPEIMNVLSMAVVQEIKHGYDISDPLGVAEKRLVVNETPRFSFSSIPSA